MSTNTIRCNTCRGQKEFAGIGGIMKKCLNCDGKGTVEAAVTVSETKLKRAYAKKAKADKADKDEPVTEELFETVIGLNGMPVEISKTTGGSIVIDEFTQAILDEPAMEALAWAQKWRHVKRLFGVNPITCEFGELVSKVQRAQIREQYAMGQPKIARTVNLSKMQDAAMGNTDVG